MSDLEAQRLIGAVFLRSVFAPQAMSPPLYCGFQQPRLSIIIQFYIKTIDYTVTVAVRLKQSDQLVIYTSFVA